MIELHNLLIKEGFGGEVDRQGIATFGFNEDMAAAVVRLQAKYGIRQTGYFGPITRAKINSLYACSPQPIPVSTPVISGVSGPTSLAVNQEGKWQVNASNRAGGTLSYSVIWGDEVQTAAGVSAPSFAPVLQQTATFTHRYLRAGNFTPTFYVTNSANQTARASLTVQVGAESTRGAYFRIYGPKTGTVFTQGQENRIKWDTYTPNGQSGDTWVSVGWQSEDGSRSGWITSLGNPGSSAGFVWDGKKTCAGFNRHDDSNSETGVDCSTLSPGRYRIVLSSWAWVFPYEANRYPFTAYSEVFTIVAAPTPVSPLTFSFSADKSQYRQDEEIQMFIKLHNQGIEPITLNFSSMCQTAYSIAGFDSTRGLNCLTTPSSVTIQPQRTYTMSFEHEPSQYRIPVGSYQLTGRLLTSYGNTTLSGSVPITILPALSDSVAPVISGVSGPTALKVNEVGEWRVNASNRAGGTLSYSVIWGDEAIPAGVAIAVNELPRTQTATFTHVYSRAGNFTPTFYVTNSANQTARASLTVQVTGTLQPTSLLKLISPARGEAVRAGTDYLIRWEATDDLVAKYPRVNIVLGGRTSNGCGAFGCGLAPSRSRFVRALEPLRLLIVKKALAEIDINAYKMTIAANISLNQGSYLWAIPADIRSRVNSINGNYELAFFDVQTGHQVYPYTDNVFLLNSAGGSVENFRLDPAINNEIVYGGDTDEAIAGLIIKTAASSDLEITMLKLVFAQQSGNWSLGEYTDEVSVWLDGQEVARFNGDELTSDNAWTKNILLDSGAIIRAGGEGKLVVKVGGVASAGASWNIDFRQIRFVDDHDDLITEDPATSPVNFSFLGGMI